ncbi:MAG: DUF695 domain-containing protein [Flavobacterium sp.]|uniref:DUF695 domain-containing protein n=1 Tax=Flavobacterium sp. TaxID=239 RepID=UPI0039197671
MSFLKNIFGKKDEPIMSYKDFWNWFQANEKTFFNVVKSHKDIEKGFFDKLSPKLTELKDGYFYLTGMYDDNTVELVLTADGNTKNIVFIEELVEQAPKINGWKFTALKPAMDIENVAINMAGYKFDSDNLFFYSNDYADYPDEIDICVIHNDRTEENKKQIGNGIYIFLDNYLGELDFLNNIDNLKFISKHEAEKELVPIAKLKDFLAWRQKEFVERYSGLRYNTENDSYSSLEGELNNGKPLVALVNSTLLDWDSKASHPWILKIEINYDGNENNGMPDNSTYELLNEFEEKIMLELKDFEGYLNIGRQTADNSREIYFACADFRKPSKVLHDLTKKYSDKLNIEYDIYKDKYWQSFERFRAN